MGSWHLTAWWFDYTHIVLQNTKRAFDLVTHICESPLLSRYKVRQSESRYRHLAHNARIAREHIIHVYNSPPRYKHKLRGNQV